MSALLKAELLRLASRRLLVLFLVCMAALAAFGAAIDAGNAAPITAQDQRSARESFKADRAGWMEQCGDPATAVPDICDESYAPSSVDSYLRVPFSFGDYAEGVILLGSPLALLAAAVLAAALVGAEFSSGNIGTQLLFTPRRVPLLLAKVTAATVGGILVVATYLGTALAFCALMFLSLRGAHDMTAGIDLPLGLGRLLVLGFLVSVMAGALTMGTGSTLITATVFAVVLVGSSTLANAISGFSPAQLFLPSNVFWTMAEGEHEIYGWTTAAYDNWILVRVMHYDWALAYSVVGTALIVLAAAWWFKRRDILR